MSVHIKVAGAWVPIGSSAAAGGPTWATVEGGTVTEFTESDGAVYEVHTITADGDLTVTKAGLAEVFLIGGGAGGSRNFPDAANGRGGDAGSVSRATFLLDAGTVPCVIGAGGGEQGAAGGTTRFGVNLLSGAGGTNRGGSGSGWGAGGPGSDAADAAGGVGVEFCGAWYGGGGGAGGHGGGATVTPGLGGSGVGGDGGVLGSGLPPANTTNSGVNPAMNAEPNTGSGGGASGTWFSPGQSDWGRGGTGSAGAIVVRVQKSAPPDSGGGDSGGGTAGMIPFTAEGGVKSRYVADGTNGEAGVAYITHTFTANGQFTANGSAFVDVLMVGGGGRGGDSVDADRGWQTGGGSGGGGQVLETTAAVTATALDVIVGGAGGNSTFAGLLARRGGNGASHGTGEGGTDVGGGGGGCMYHDAAGGTAVAGQGANGGQGGSLRSGGAGGGGGPQATAASGGTAGTGTTSALTGTAYRYGDGGPHAVENNTGHGGSGAGGGGTGSPGSSGLVVVRYREDKMIPDPNAGGGGVTYMDATGGTITEVTEGGKKFRVHTFTESGALGVLTGGVAEVLVIGAGGGGGACGYSWEPGGGGGAGGWVFQKVAFVPQGYPVVIGQGGGAGTGWRGGGAPGGSTWLQSAHPDVPDLFARLTGVGGGGGGNGAGANASGTAGQDAGAAGKVSSIAGTAITYSVPGTTKGGPQPGAANTGNGGDGNNAEGQAGAGGGSGRVVIKYEIAA